MTDAEFMDRAEILLRSIEASCDRLNDESDADIDNQRVGNMLTLTFATRTQIILNLQKPLHEVWMAAKSGGYHFRWVNSAWSDTKGGGTFAELLNRSASEQSGQELVFSLA